GFEARAQPITCPRRFLTSKMRGVIDCDLPAAAPPVSALHEHLDGYWRDTVVERGLRSIEPSYELPGTGHREPAMPADAELAVVNPISAIEALHSEDLAAALARGLKEWLRSRGLAAGPRLRGPIPLAPPGPELPGGEMERLEG